MDAFEQSGFWWLPGTIGGQVPGQLMFVPGGAPRLSLLGAFPTTFPRVLMGDDQELIQGALADGTAVTLYKCADAHVTTGTGLTRPSYQASYLLLRHHFESAASVRFPILRAEFSHLPDWVVAHGFTLQHGPGGLPFGVSYDTPPRLSAAVRSGLTIGIGYGFKSEWRQPRQWTLTQTPVVEMRSATPLHIDEWLDGPLGVVNNLLAFGLGVAVYPTRVTGFASDDPSDRGVNICFNTGQGEGHGTPPQFADILFSLPDIAPTFESFVARWFDLSDSLRSVFELYFGTLFGGSMYIHHQFLSLAQALESYHRLLHNRRLIDDENVVKRLRDALIAAIPADLDPSVRCRVRNSFNFLNEITLADRLSDLLDLAPATVLERAIPDKQEFANKVRWTRNYFTHYDMRNERRAAKGVELLNLSDRMRWLLDGLFLADLRLPPETIATILQRNARLARVGSWRLVGG